jgi:hypothetical protein
VRPGVTTDMAARVKELKREVRELRQTNEILKKASRISPSRGQKAGGSSPKVPRSGDLGEARPPVAEVIAFMDDHRGEHRLEPMCRVLSIRPCENRHRYRVIGQCSGKLT